jgi:DNA-binding transcriptional ArsR family regulator
MADGYLEPGFEDGALFRATLRPHPSFADSRTPSSRQRGGISGGISGGIAGLGRGDVARRRQAVLDALAKEGGLDANELRERLSVAPRTLERDLAALREAGLVVREGSRKTGLYRTVETSE